VSVSCLACNYALKVGSGVLGPYTNSCNCGCLGNVKVVITSKV